MLLIKNQIKQITVDMEKKTQMDNAFVIRNIVGSCVKIYKEILKLLID